MTSVYVNGLNSVQAWREYKGITQKDIAASMQVTQSAYSQLEKRGYHTARQDTKKALCDALGVSAGQLDIRNEP
jgi:transcriptional regulator with XRE-family HTH domain